jgi:hypothetical protein
MWAYRLRETITLGSEDDWQKLLEILRATHGRAA